MAAGASAGYITCGMVPSVERAVTGRHLYQRKPLREALYELFVEPEVHQPERVARFWSLLPEFAHHEERVDEVGLHLNFTSDGVLPTQKREQRIRRWDLGHQRVLQLAPNMCAYNVLGPAYTRFEDQVPVIKRVLLAYVEALTPAHIGWLGQRYLNSIKLPLDDLDAAKYLPLHPSLPEKLRGPRPLAVQVQTDDSAMGSVVANLSFTGIEPPNAVYTLDVYARSKGPLPMDAEALARWHEKVHGSVNAAFEMSISNRYRDMFMEES
jgi:uncharacterized protein (TIGR04255 family)